MNLPDPLIIKFIKKHHVLTLATSLNELPWVASCYYAYNAESNYFIVSSDPKTRHGSDMLQNHKVAFNIVLETKIVGMIEGLQASATIISAKDFQGDDPSNYYYKRFPFAKMMHTDLWVIMPDFYKYTDNKLGFGKKLIWEKSESL